MEAFAFFVGFVGGYVATLIVLAAFHESIKKWFR